MLENRTTIQKLEQIVLFIFRCSVHASCLLSVLLLLFISNSFRKWFFCPHEIFIAFPQSVVQSVFLSQYLPMCVRLCLRWWRTQNQLLRIYVFLSQSLPASLSVCHPTSLYPIRCCPLLKLWVTVHHHYESTKNRDSIDLTWTRKRAT